MDFDMIQEDWENEAPKLTAIERKNPFLVPENYFVTLKQDIEAASCLDALKKQVQSDGFNVPDHYFNTLKTKISAEVFDKQRSLTARIRPLWIKYAAAACFVIAVSIPLMLRTQPNGIESQLNRIPDNDIVNYLQTHADAGDTPFIIENLSNAEVSLPVVPDVSKQDLENYLNSTSL